MVIESSFIESRVLPDVIDVWQFLDGLYAEERYVLADVFQPGLKVIVENATTGLQAIDVGRAGDRADFVAHLDCQRIEFSVGEKPFRLSAQRCFKVSFGARIERVMSPAQIL